MRAEPTTVTVLPAWVHVAFQPDVICCSPVGQSKVSVQSASAFVPVFVMSTAPTNPLLQSLTLDRRTEQVLWAGLPVVTVSGGEDQDRAPAASRASTLTVFLVTGLR